MTRIRATLIAIAVGAGALATAAPTGAAAATPHRALVVIETGTARYERVVTFTSDSVTGIQALELAGASPVVYSFSGQGGAVCRLFGVGRDAGPNCLGGADGDNRYWAYFRAPAGTANFTYSRAGAGNVQVHDGDVEGWRFGTGAAPGWAALPPVTTTTTRPVVTPPPAGSGGNGGPAVTAGPTGAGPATPAPGAPVDPAALAAFLAAAGVTTTTVPADAPQVGSAGEERATARSDGTEVEAAGAQRSVSGSVTEGTDDDGGGAGSLVIFAVIAAALVGGGLLLRRSRARPVP